MNEGMPGVSGRDAIQQIAKSKEAVLLSHDRETGEDRIVHGTVVVAERGFVFKRASGDDYLTDSSGENGWAALSDDPWRIGLRMKSTDQIIAAREPSPEEYEKWRSDFERRVRQ